MKTLPFERILALSPHPDDIEFGCGGLLARLLEQGAEVHTAVFSPCEESVPEGYPKDILFQEMAKSADVFGIPEANRHTFHFPVRRFSEHRQDILEEIVGLKRSLQPDLILTPSTHDIHQDHATISQESIRAFRYQTILGYELPWNNLQFSTQVLIEITPAHLEKKTSAVKCYESQSFRHYSGREMFRSQAMLHGVQGRLPHSEAFESIRIVL